MHAVVSACAIMPPTIAAQILKFVGDRRGRVVMRGASFLADRGEGSSLQLEDILLQAETFKYIKIVMQHVHAARN